MICEPKLFSFCLKPQSHRIAKFTRAHEYIETHPYVEEQIIKKSGFRNHQIPNFKVEISKYDLDGREINVDDICNLLIYWDLTDTIGVSEGSDSFVFTFRSGISAYVSSKIPKIRCKVIGNIPNNARVPIVYIQGIGKDVEFREIEQYFRNIAPILKIKYVEKENYSFHILKFSSIRNTIKAFETANGEIFKESTLTVSYQYKSHVTRTFFIQIIHQNKINCINVDEINNQIRNIGDIELSFYHINDDAFELFVKMKNIQDSKYSCGLMNYRVYKDFVLNSYFIEEKYFNEMYIKYRNNMN